MACAPVTYDIPARQLFGFASLSAQPNPSGSNAPRYVKFARCPSMACDSVTGIRLVSESGGAIPNPAQRYWKRENPASSSTRLDSGDVHVAWVTLYGKSW